MALSHEEIRQLDAVWHVPAYGRFDVALVSGQGAIARDADGREYVDFGAGIGVNALGYSDPGWAQAVAAQAARLQHTSNLYCSDAQAVLARDLCQAADMKRVFFCNSGAEANECAIKVARKYSYDTYGPGRDRIVTLRNSFHGRTVTTLAATGQDGFHQFFFPFTEGFVYAAAGDLDDLRDKADGSVCALFIELIQGEGGVVPLDKDYVQAAAALCRERDILLLIDEVQTGVGRTGSLYAYQQFGVRPDVVTSAKGLAGGLPFGACLCGDKTAGVLTAGMHGSTFGGNPVCCAAASYVLSRVNDRAFLAEVARKGAWLRQRLAELPDVETVTGMGLMLGVSLRTADARRTVARCADEGLLILTAKDRLRLLPPLTITEEEMQRGLAVLERVLKEETHA